MAGFDGGTRLRAAPSKMKCIMKSARVPPPAQRSSKLKQFAFASFPAHTGPQFARFDDSVSTVTARQTVCSRRQHS